MARATTEAATTTQLRIATEESSTTTLSGDALETMAAAGAIVAGLGCSNFTVALCSGVFGWGGMRMRAVSFLGETGAADTGAVGAPGAVGSEGLTPSTGGFGAPGTIGFEPGMGGKIGLGPVGRAVLN